MAEISFIRVKSTDLKFVKIPYQLMETYDIAVESSTKYIHCQTDIKNLKSELSEKYKELFDIKHPAE